MIRLTEREVYLAVGGDKELLKQSGKAQVCEGYMNIAKAQHKKMVKILKEDTCGGAFAISLELWERLEKEAE